MQVRYDAELAALRGGVERVVVELVAGAKSTPASRKAILPHMDDLAAFLGRQSVPTALIILNATRPHVPAELLPTAILAFLTAGLP